MKFATIIVAASLATVTLTGASSAPQPALDGPAPACISAQLLALRGSGELKYNPEKVHPYKTLHSHGFEGEPIRRVLQEVERVAPTTGLDLRRISMLDVDYDAVRVEDAQKLGEDVATKAASAGPLAIRLGYSVTLAEILRSSRTGVTNGLKAVTKAQRSTPLTCAQPEVALMGYSQGQMAVRQLFPAISAAVKIRTSMSFGDPFQEGQDNISEQQKVGLYGTGAGGSGIFVKEADLVKERLGKSNQVDYTQLRKFYGASGLTSYSLCHKGDPMCDYAWLGGLLVADEHNNYARNDSGHPGELTKLGKWLSTRLAKTPPAAEAPNPSASKLFLTLPTPFASQGRPLPVYIEGG